MRAFVPGGRARGVGESGRSTERVGCQNWLDRRSSGHNRPQ